MKLTPLQGILFALLILGVIGGAMNVTATYLQSLGTQIYYLGIYGFYIVEFVRGYPFVVVLTTIYNIVIYINRYYSSDVGVIKEAYDTTKFAKTLTLFTGFIGPIVAVAPPEWKVIGGLVVFFVLALANEINHIFEAGTPTPPPTPIPG